MTTVKENAVTDSLRVYDEFRTLGIDDLPPFRLDAYIETDTQIANYLKKLVRTYGMGSQPTVVLPPIYALACFFCCSELDVFDAFQELKQQGYHYRIQGLDALITLHDPLPESDRYPSPWWSTFVEPVNRLGYRKVC
jgi:hypothetical protein